MAVSVVCAIVDSWQGEAEFREDLDLLMLRGLEREVPVPRDLDLQSLLVRRMWTPILLRLSPSSILCGWCTLAYRASVEL